MTALVLSAGGMYGAYQAGAWAALSEWLGPDVVVGASVGALNGWAIAGGATPADLRSYWTDPELARVASIRLTQPLWRGCFDSRPLHDRIERLWAAYRPRVRVAVVATEIPALRPRIFCDSEITWRHLAASCAVLLGYRQVRIEGRLYTDGGLLDALPLWAAAALGAERIVAVNALSVMPSRAVRAFVRMARALAPRPGASSAGSRSDVQLIQPSGALGPLREAVFWNRHAVERWIAQGEADARRMGLEWKGDAGL